jgi:hypothetical protein
MVVAVLTPPDEDTALLGLASSSAVGTAASDKEVSSDLLSVNAAGFMVITAIDIDQVQCQIK